MAGAGAAADHADLPTQHPAVAAKGVFMNLLAHLPWHRALPAPRQAPAAAVTVPAAGEPDAADADEDTASCGWFDSSHDLQYGLLVTEHASADAVANELPLEAWLDLHLSGWRPPQGGVH
jgi:hypothetical protein